MKKIINPGKIVLRNRKHNIFCKIHIKHKNKGKVLSISGVISPNKRGNAAGGCGQIAMEFAHRDPADNDDRYTVIPPEKMIFTAGWNKELWFDFLDIWEKWHLNDTRAGCEHQRVEGWGHKKLNIVHVDIESWKVKGGIKPGSYPERLIKKVREAALKGEFYIPKDSVEESWFDGEIIKLTTEKKSSGWVYPEEHPEGVLGKACSICGYKYGTSWLHEPLPKDVVRFLNNLPETEIIPAWI